MSDNQFLLNAELDRNSSDILNAEDLLRFLASYVLKQLNCSSSAVYLFDAGPDHQVLKATSDAGDIGKTLPTVTRMAQLDSPTVRKVTATKQPLLTIPQEQAASGDPEHEGSSITVPIISRAQVIGAIHCKKVGAAQLTESHLELLKKLAVFTSRKHEALRLSGEAERQSFDRTESTLPNNYSSSLRLSDASASWAWEQDTDFRFTSVSHFKDIPFLRQQGEILGKTRWEALGVDPEQDDRWRTHLDDLKAFKPIRDFVYTLNDWYDRPHVFSVNGDPVYSPGGAFQGYKGTVTDITDDIAAHSADERFLRAIDHVYEGFALWGPDEKLVMFNARMRELSGLPDEILQPGLSFHDWIAERLKHGRIPEVFSDWDEWIATRVELMRNPPQEPIEVLREGHWYQLQYLKLDDGSTVQTIRDIDDRKSAERAKSQFTATVSHELRTPLASILGALQIIRSGALGPLTDRMQELVDVCLRNSNRLSSLISEILDLEAISVGQLSLKLEKTQVTSILTEAITLNEPMATANGVLLICTHPTEPIEVNVDPNRLQQILSNLISNAIKFSDAGTTVEIEARDTGVFVEFRVLDCGVGIPADFLPKLYERFEQADGSDSRKVGGSGLGLSITKALVEMHGGTLTCSSEVGIGSTFVFTIPRLSD